MCPHSIPAGCNERSSIAHHRSVESPIQFRGHFRVVHLVAGSVLIVAAAAKTLPLRSVDPIPNATAEGLGEVLYFLSFCELALGLWLISGKWPSQAHTAACIVFVGFASHSLRAIWSGDPSCGCFGESVVISPWYTFAVAAAAMVAFATCRTTRGENQASRRLSAVLISNVMLCLLLTAGAIAGWMSGAFLPSAFGGIQSGTAIDPKTWIGHRFPLIDQIDIGNRISVGRWKVLLYRSSCPKCQQALSRLQESADTVSSMGLQATSPFAAIEVPPFYLDAIAQHLDWCHNGCLVDDKTFFIETPLLIELKDGIVLYTSSQDDSIATKDGS